MVILGIDPGLAIVGWGVLRFDGFRFQPLGYGSIQTPAGIQTEERLAQIYEGMNQLIDTYHPDEMAVEELFFNNNITTFRQFRYIIVRINNTDTSTDVIFIQIINKILKKTYMSKI